MTYCVWCGHSVDKCHRVDPDGIRRCDVCDVEAAANGPPDRRCEVIA